ncbi:MAG: L-2-hydroxyglutarate oxidase [Saprospiraceae bacterium]|nr:L-2-hydroxyglutarate oxidase [Saprospiraceae bacterium]
MKTQVTIIGGGIVGLATAWRLAEAHRDLVITVLEKENDVAAHQTGHNSGVIHSGIYYRPGSLRAMNCRDGYVALLEFCQKYDIAHDICGKVIVATREWERSQLDKIMDHGRENGLQGIRRISAEEVQEREPHVQAVEGIWVPQTGIIDYVQVTQTYARLIQERGHQIKFGFQVKAMTRHRKRWRIFSLAGDVVEGELVINCAGLFADKVVQMTGQNLGGVQIIPFRGEYYNVVHEKEHLVNNLIYPVPNPAFPFLGVHYTRMIHGGIEAGPSAVLAFAREGYSRYQVNAVELLETITHRGFLRMARKHWRFGWDEMVRSFSKKAFVTALQHLIPEIGMQDLVRGGAGVRAMACSIHGELLDDFLILETEGVINVVNAPSPAATASLAIGQTIAKAATRQLTA